MDWKKEFRMALVLGTEGLVIAGAGSSLSLTGYNIPRTVRPSIRERLNGLKNTLATLLTVMKRNSDDWNHEQFFYGPGLDEQFPRFNAEREAVLNAIQQRV